MIRTRRKPFRPGRPRSLDARQAILESTCRLVTLGGLAETSIANVARGAGVSKVTIYKWWASREDLLTEVLLEKAPCRLTPATKGNARARLVDHATSYAEALNGDFGKLLLAIIAERTAFNRELLPYLRHNNLLCRNVILDTIDAGRRDGSIATRTSASDLSEQIYGAIVCRFLFRPRALTKRSVRLLVGSALLERQ